MSSQNAEEVDDERHRFLSKKSLSEDEAPIFSSQSLGGTSRVERNEKSYTLVLQSSWMPLRGVTIGSVAILHSAYHIQDDSTAVVPYSSVTAACRDKAGYSLVRVHTGGTVQLNAEVEVFALLPSSFRMSMAMTLRVLCAVDMDERKLKM
ncbi:uncharacterized protein EV420DRAFT_1643310 [Desarmillaria tabescens]|uniref:Uncharacterized protein n=1 Tax=Armillaria tabescens TaxID=1929756 RepID=A0AA39N5A4_ARMTA|nr:uncharacterized protein EV420DRAFT_1643310 [Desarmillaria tabescens]KAK0457953.1 hypothetical protein EV420DRAFT_1643310 [Desarmillaria tabescens]